MAIGSVLNPERIVGKQNTNQQLAKNFISGDSFLGTSSIASVANKIVGFQRGTAKPVPSSVDSIVSTISTNITNNITSTLNNTLQSFTADYKKRVSDVDSAKPTGILSKFLSTYKDVIKFIQFFGNKKFVNGISDNLKNLSKSFTESFEVAKLIRQVIVKIVQQLSNLPKATPGGGGGIDIDVDVPMGGVRKSAPRGLGNMFKGRGKMLALGAGALGVGAVGAGAVNALSNVDEIRAGMFQPEDGGDIISTFSSAIERFIAAINTMVGIGKGSKPPGGGGGGGGGSPGSPGPGGPGPGGPSTDMSKTLTPGDSPPEIKALMDAIASTEGTWDSVNYGKGPGKIAGLENMTIDEALTASDSYINQYGGTGALGRYQHHPTYLRKRAIDAGLDPTKDKFTKENQTLIQRVFLSSTFGGEQKLVEQVRKKDWKGLSYELGRNIGWPSLPYGSQSQPGYTPEMFGQKIEKSLQRYVSGTGGPTPDLKPKPGIGGSYDELTPESAAAYMSGKLEQYKNLATNVSQPVQTASQSQTNIVPIDLSGTMPQQSQGGGGGVSAPPSTQKNGPSVPLLPSANTDNFLVLYSRMVYNIVDG